MSGETPTPGPWTACKDGACSCGQVFAEFDKHVATAHAATEDSNGEIYATWAAEERQANARLIAAAPDLLEALVGVVNWYGLRDNHDPMDKLLPGSLQKPEIRNAMAALAKARGEQDD